MSVNEEHATNSDSNNIQKESQELKEFVEIKANIALEASLRQESEEAEKQLEEALQSLMRDGDSKNTKPINAPISAHFKSNRG